MKLADRVGSVLRGYELNGSGRLLLFPRGAFQHPQYGRLEFDDEFFEEIKRNFDERVLGHTEPFIDIDHSHGAAAGWIKALSVEPDGLWAQVEWTPLGEEMIRSRQYRFFSPWFGPYKDPESGKTYERVLRGGGLTNVPFLKVLPPVELWEPGVDSPARRQAHRRGVVVRLSELVCDEHGQNLESLPTRVRAAFTRRFQSNGALPSPWVVEVWDDAVVAQDEGRFFVVPWEDMGGEIVFHPEDRYEVRQAWVPVADEADEDGDEGRDGEDLAAALAEARWRRVRRLAAALNGRMAGAS